MDIESLASTPGMQALMQGSQFDTLLNSMNFKCLKKMRFLNMQTHQ